MKKNIFLYLGAAALTGMMLMAGCGMPGSSGSSAGQEDNPNNAMFSSTEDEPEAVQTADAQEPQAVQPDTPEILTGLHHAQIDVRDYGVIEVELDADTAPLTVTNFVKLARSGFYDGLTFHRIISGFMIQGGDPLGNGRGGSDETIKGEFSSNGVENNITHERGVISMARSSDPDSASSQFFIMHQKADYLDGEYAAFGHVTAGIEVVDKICDDARPVDSNGTIEKENQPVIQSIKILD